MSRSFRRRKPHFLIRLLLVALVAGLICLVGPSPASVADPPASGQTYNAKGLDLYCNPSEATMASLWSGNSPWYWMGIYIGGVSMYCDHAPPATWVADELAANWGLLPTWVGLQAPCSGLAHVMSTDTTTAFGQGESAATQARNKVANLGIGSNGPIVYDMEDFSPANTTCMNAVKAYMRGWDTIMANSPSMDSGYYGSAAASYPTDIWGISPRPTFAWIAAPANPPDPDVWNTNGHVSTTIWPVRDKQYGQTTINGIIFDMDCALGPIFAYYPTDAGVCE